MTHFVRKLLCLCGAICTANVAQAEDSEDKEGGNHITVGVGALWQEAPFNQAKNQTIPLPLISVKQGAYYFETAETGVRFEQQLGAIKPSVDLFVAARGTSGQDRQKLTADAGARISLATDFGTLSGAFRHDITGKFNGSEFTARYSVPISIGRFTVTPAAQASWLDRRTANHMYGITAEQRAKMISKQRNVVLPVAPIIENAVNLGSDVSMAFQLNERLTLIGVVGGTYLDKSIHRSIAIDKKYECQGLVGITYNF
jgi:outer membrane scaffolding protein for murein synthesis (MipA/OmpV family)